MLDCKSSTSVKVCYTSLFITLQLHWTLLLLFIVLYLVYFICTRMIYGFKPFSGLMHLGPKTGPLCPSYTLYDGCVFCSWLQVMGPESTELIHCLKLNTAGLLAEILTFLWHLIVRYCVYRSLNHLNLFYTLVTYFFNIYFNTVSHLR